jgi:outer membrane receptor protein involved in Fe transport
MAALLSVIHTAAWADDEPKENILGAITVKGEAMEESNQSFTVNMIDREQLEERNISDVLRAIEETAGMTMSTGAYAQGGVASAFQIRGFAEGGHGSDAAVYIDGISLNEGGSHGDGYADTNVIMPIELETISIYKGPISPLYGNFARAGTLAFETRKGGKYQESDLFIGSYDTVNAQMAIGNYIGPISVNLAVQGYDTSGYREHQDYTKVNASGRIAYEIDEVSEVALSVRRHSGHFNSPGYITEEQFNSGEDGRRGRAPTAEDDGGSKTFTSQRIDYNTMINDNIMLLTYGYGVDQDSVRFAKFSYTENGQSERIYSRSGIGLGASLNGETSILDIPASWVAGVEYFDETTDAARYNSKDRVRGDVTQSQELTTETTSLFGQMDIALSDTFTSTLGLRYDSFDGDALDKITNTTSSMEDYSNTSPKLGIRYTISPNWQLRGSAAHGFALPAGEAKYDASIQVEPVDYLQYEVGINGSLTANLNVDLAAFMLDSSGEYQQVGGETVNYGETRRTGLEAEVRYNLTTHLELVGLLGLFDSEIQKGDNVGKSVTGVPKHTATLKASYTPTTGLGGSIAWRSTGKYYITGDNSQSYEGFEVVDLTAFFNINGGGNMKLYAQVNNVFDEAYAEAVWYGDSANYAPAAGRNIGVGLTTKW